MNTKILITAGIGIVTSVSAFVIGFKLGKNKGYKDVYEMMEEKNLEIVPKKEVVPNEPIGYGCIEENEPEPEEENYEEEAEEIRYTSGSEVDLGEAKEVEAEILGERIRFMDVSEETKWVEGFDYSQEELNFYPEDEKICETFIGTDGYPMEPEELLTTVGYDNVDEFRQRFDAMHINGKPIENLYVLNHDNMCIYTICCLPGIRGVYAEDGYEFDDEANDYPECV